LLKGSHHSALVDFSFLDHLSRGGGGIGGGAGALSGGEDRGSSGAGLSREALKTGRILGKLFPTRVAISLPKDGDKLAQWREQIDHDVECVKAVGNRQNILRALQRSNVALSDPELQIAALRKQIFSPDAVDKIVGWAISDHLQRTVSAEVRASGQLIISPENIERAIAMLASSEPDARKRSLLEVETENEFEKRLLAEVIPPEEVSLSFDDIGALEEVKETLRELVMLPLQRPELFRKGNLTRPCKGILLFGPPGTGKTMLAKAVATESGANFINVTMSSIASKWFGEGEKYVKAVFTLASKIAPSVIFVDEVDSILGKRERAGEAGSRARSDKQANGPRRCRPPQAQSAHPRGSAGCREP
jgi:SpoVK/Ycf46/Vps4 family AAA+-type ATPase